MGSLPTRLQVWFSCPLGLTLPHGLFAQWAAVMVLLLAGLGNAPWTLCPVGCSYGSLARWAWQCPMGSLPTGLQVWFSCPLRLTLPHGLFAHGAAVMVLFARWAWQCPMGSLPTGLQVWLSCPLGLTLPHGVFAQWAEVMVLLPAGLGNAPWALCPLGCRYGFLARWA